MTVIPAELAGAHFVAVHDKTPIVKGWPDNPLPLAEAEQRLATGGNVAVRLGPASGDIVDVDLDCNAALALADTYLPSTAEFGRPSKPRSHRLYRSPGAVFASFADPTDGEMLIELRADGRDGGAHLTLIPPSVTSGERREWCGEIVDPAIVDAAVLARRCGWLATGCLMMRHVSEHAARRPGPDLPDLLWEADSALGRKAFHWVGRLAPDERPPDLKPRRQYLGEELRLEEIVAAIPNRCGWDEWNRVGLAVFAASGGSDLGFVAFDDFSSRLPKYDPHAVLERWRNYRRSPPSRISLGTLVHLAREAGWRRSAA
jgi:hypothetical protein